MTVALAEPAADHDVVRAVSVVVERIGAHDPAEQVLRGAAGILRGVFIDRRRPPRSYTTRRRSQPTRPPGTEPTPAASQGSSSSPPPVDINRPMCTSTEPATLPWRNSKGLARFTQARPRTGRTNPTPEQVYPPDGLGANQESGSLGGRQPIGGPNSGDNWRWFERRVSTKGFGKCRSPLMIWSGRLDSNQRPLDPQSISKCRYHVRNAVSCPSSPFYCPRKSIVVYAERLA